MSEIINIGSGDKRAWAKVDAYLARQTYTADDVNIDFNSGTFEEDGMHLTGLVDVFVPVGVYRKVKPPETDPKAELRELVSLLEHHPDFYKVNSFVRFCAIKARKALG